MRRSRVGLTATMKIPRWIWILVGAVLALVVFQVAELF